MLASAGVWASRRPHCHMGAQAIPSVTGSVERWAIAGIRQACAFQRQGLKFTPQLKRGMTMLQNELLSGCTISYSNPNSPFRHMNSPGLKYPSLPLTVFSL